MNFEITEKDISDVITSLSQRLDEELFKKTEAELEENWFFRWDDVASLEKNIYNFCDMLNLYGSSCERWEEKHNGSCCLVERVRDKYLMPKIKLFVKQIKEVKMEITLENAPIGTRAPAYGGGFWEKVTRGWKWCNSGDTFPRPGGDWNGKLVIACPNSNIKGLKEI